MKIWSWLKKATRKKDSHSLEKVKVRYANGNTVPLMQSGFYNFTTMEPNYKELAHFDAIIGVPSRRVKLVEEDIWAEY
jgi:hypothetical protein